MFECIIDFVLASMSNRAAFRLSVDSKDRTVFVHALLNAAGNLVKQFSHSNDSVGVSFPSFVIDLYAERTQHAANVSIFALFQSTDAHSFSSPLLFLFCRILTRAAAVTITYFYV